VPGTKEGLPAIKQLIGEGINVNVTLLFGLSRYREVAEAYVAGLETRVAQGKSLKGVASVASFFLSRIDSLIDPMLKKVKEQDKSKTDLVDQLLGQVAILSAKTAYLIYKEIFDREQFVKLQTQGAQNQRLLWASTSTKNPDYSDLKYVDGLIGTETINTIPLDTLAAYRDHGDPARRLVRDELRAHETLKLLPEVGIDMDKATQQLEDEGVEKFTKSFDDLMKALKKKRAKH
jgi:transaldolase